MSKAIFLAGGFAASLMLAQGVAHAAQTQAAADAPPAGAGAEAGAASLTLTPERPKVLIEPFAATAAGAGVAATETACPAEKSAPGAAPSKLEFDLALDVSKALKKKLAGRMDVLPDAGPESAGPESAGPESAGPESLPNGALVIVGCLTRTDGGNAAERLVGFGLGASHLNAHVKFLTKTDEGLELVHAFDVKATGRNLLPPISPVGLAVRGVTSFRKTLAADAGKVAGQIASCALKSTGRRQLLLTRCPKAFSDPSASHPAAAT